jgi:hypothetical protein
MKNVLRIPILNDEYNVIVTWGNCAEIAKALKKYYYLPEDIEYLYERMGEQLEDVYPKVRGICFHRHGNLPVITLPCFPTEPDEIATLAHEACHAIEYIMSCLCASDEEIFAHSVAAIMRYTLGSKHE